MPHRQEAICCKPGEMKAPFREAPSVLAGPFKLLFPVRNIHMPFASDLVC